MTLKLSIRIIECRKNFKRLKISMQIHFQYNWTYFMTSMTEEVCKEMIDSLQYAFE